MTVNLTAKQIDILWEKGFRPYEIYTFNPETVEYYGEIKQPGSIKGWDIKHVFSTREFLKSYPFFDCVIGSSAVSICDECWKGESKV